MNKPLLVLIADDYEGVAEMLGCLLEATIHCEVLSVVNGAEAVRAALDRRPDAVVLDIDMPVMGGIEAARNLRTRLHGPGPLLIALSGGANLDSVRGTGLFDHTFSKPADIERLTELLRDLRPQISNDNDSL